MSKEISSVSEEVMARFLRYPWPGNVRELENVIERAVALEAGSVILPDRLPDTLQGRSGMPVSDYDTLPDGFDLDGHLRLTEANLVRRALLQASGDRPKACRILGVSPRSLRYLLAKHQIAEPT